MIQYSLQQVLDLIFAKNVHNQCSSFFEQKNKELLTVAIFLRTQQSEENKALR